MVKVDRHYCIGNTDYISGIVCGNGVWINIFPVKIEVIIIVVLILLSALALYLQFLKYGWVKWAARVIALLLAVILAIGDLYIYQAKEAMNYVSNNEQTEVISVYVLKR